MPEATGRGTGNLPSRRRNTSPALSHPPPFLGGSHPTLGHTYTHPHFPGLGNAEQTFALTTLNTWNPGTYGCSGGDSAPRRWLRCCRCWPAPRRSPGSRGPGSLPSRRASACGRHAAPVTLPLAAVPLPHLLVSSSEGTFGSLEKGVSICFAMRKLRP